jgi:hypothetical protein
LKEGETEKRWEGGILSSDLSELTKTDGSTRVSRVRAEAMVNVKFLSSVTAPAGTVSVTFPLPALPNVEVFWSLVSSRS